MNILSKLYYRYKKILKVIRLFLIIAGPGIIVMVADNDAGGITTYTATDAQQGALLRLCGPLRFGSIAVSDGADTQALQA